MMIGAAVDMPTNMPTDAKPEAWMEVKILSSSGKAVKVAWAPDWAAGQDVTGKIDAGQDILYQSNEVRSLIVSKDPSNNTIQVQDDLPWKTGKTWVLKNANWRLSIPPMAVIEFKKPPVVEPPATVVAPAPVIQVPSAVQPPATVVAPAPVIHVPPAVQPPATVVAPAPVIQVPLAVQPATIPAYEPLLASSTEAQPAANGPPWGLIVAGTAALGAAVLFFGRKR